MRTLQVDYEAVTEKVMQLRSHIRTNIVSQVEGEYHKLQSSLKQLDGAACASLREALDENRQKALAGASVLERLLSFMSNASQQIQIAENQISRTFMATRRQQ